MSEDGDRGTVDEEECEGCPCCADLDLDSEDLALISLGAGIMSAVFGLFGCGHAVLHFLALPLGLIAVVCAYKALKQGTPRDKAALKGLALGVTGVALFLVTSLIQTVAGWWR